MRARARAAEHVAVPAAARKAAKPAGKPADFAAQLIAWQRRHGRNDLPWQNTRDAYRIWLSEIMLQQTQVGTVIPYYRTFLEHFPDVASLAAADLNAVLRLWSGLGYYSRARNLHRAANALVAVHGGAFPRGREALEALPGVGRSTAAAIVAFAFRRSEAILDGNVRRVLARHFAVAGFPGDAKVAAKLWTLAESLLPARGIARYTQALMDLGATVCTRKPSCERCPVRASCRARAEGATASYPWPRPRRSVPVRETRMLLLVSQGRLLLEKRAAAGIWGGLWCFPEIGIEEEAAAVCEARFGLRAADVEHLPVLPHSFTHFTLRIHPVACRVADGERVADGGATAWMTLQDAAADAIPVPVRKLLDRLPAALLDAADKAGG
ncbi:MAG: A/G-specific adenine glycosylase [Betaproteobacteria bacterium]|nr:A/G-specific adenine glycosylase [Betaproteobacteria bacterium]